MIRKLYLILGLFLIVDVIYKLVRCASCDSDYLGFEVSGYTYIAIQTFFAFILLYSAYREWGKKEQTNKEVENKNYLIAGSLVTLTGFGVMGYSHGSGLENYHGQILVFIGLVMCIVIPLLNKKKNNPLND